MTPTNKGIDEVIAGLESEFKAMAKGIDYETLRIVDGSYIHARYSSNMETNIRVMFAMGVIKDHGDSYQSLDRRDLNYWHISMDQVKKTLNLRWHLWRDKDLDINLGFMLIGIYQDHLREGLDKS